MANIGAPGRGRRPVLARVAVVVSVAGGVALAARTGLLGFVGDEDRLADFFRDNGAVGPLVFVAAFALVQPFGGVPGIAFVIPAAAVWPLPVAFALSYVGVMAASTVAFLAARFVLRDWVDERMPYRVRRWEQRLSGSGTKGVVLLRLGTFMMSPADWLLGVSNVTFRQFLVGTAIGMVPVCLVAVATGGGIVEAFSALSPAGRAGVVGLLALLVLRAARSHTKEQPVATTARSTTGSGL